MRQSKNIPGLQEGHRKNFHQVNKTSFLTALSAIVLLLVPECMIKFGQLTVHVRSFWYCVMLSKSPVNFAIFLWRHREFRDMVLSIFRPNRVRCEMETTNLSAMMRANGSNRPACLG
ncbi:unnamed protein product, partial [Mesorhabditis spiculigera]